MWILRAFPVSATSRPMQCARQGKNWERSTKGHSAGQNCANRAGSVQEVGKRSPHAIFVFAGPRNPQEFWFSAETSGKRRTTANTRRWDMLRSNGGLSRMKEIESILDCRSLMDEMIGRMK